MTVLFVGEATNRARDGRWLHIYLYARALGEGSAYRRDPRAWLRLAAKNTGRTATARALCRSVQVNLFEDWPGSAGKGSRFPLPEARGRAAALLLSVRAGFEFDGSDVAAARRVVLVGRRVASAFGLERRPFYEWLPLNEIADLPAVIVPHPSGVSRVWNDPATRLRVLSAVLAALVA